jgi:hypothetical protein
MANARAARAGALPFRMPAGRTPAQTGLAVSRGLERSRRLLVTPRSSGLRTRQAYAPLPLAASAEAGSSMTSTMHKIKRMMRLRFFALLRARGVFRMQLRAQAVPAKLGCGALHRLAPLVGRWSNQLRSARSICPASVSAPKAGRSINISMSGSMPKRRVPGVSRHRKRERAQERQQADRRSSR